MNSNVKVRFELLPRLMVAHVNHAAMGKIKVGIGLQALFVDFVPSREAIAHIIEFKGKSGILQRDIGYAAQIIYADGRSLIGYSFGGFDFLNWPDHLLEEALSGDLLVPSSGEGAKDIPFFAVSGAMRDVTQLRQDRSQWKGWDERHFELTPTGLSLAVASKGDTQNETTT